MLRAGRRVAYIYRKLREKKMRQMNIREDDKQEEYDKNDDILRRKIIATHDAKKNDRYP